MRHRTEVIEGVRSHPESVPIDGDSVRAYVASSPDIGRLDRQLAELRNAAVVESDDRTFDLRAIQLRAAGLTMIGEIDRATREQEQGIIEFARIWLTDAPQVASVKAGYSLFFLCYLAAAKLRSVEEVAKYLRAARITRLAPPDETVERVAAQVVEVYNRVIPEDPRH